MKIDASCFRLHVRYITCPPLLYCNTHQKLLGIVELTSGNMQYKINLQADVIFPEGHKIKIDPAIAIKLIEGIAIEKSVSLPAVIKCI